MAEDEKKARRHREKMCKLDKQEQNCSITSCPVVKKIFKGTFLAFKRLQELKEFKVIQVDRYLQPIVKLY